MDKLIKHKFSVFGIKPNDLEKGSLLLFFLGIYNLGTYFFISRIELLIIGVLFILFGICAYKGLSIFLYIGAIIWFIGILLSIVSVFLARIENGAIEIPSSFYGILFLQVGFFWALIKSLPIYSKMYEKKNKDKNEKA